MDGLVDFCPEVLYNEGMPKSILVLWEEMENKLFHSKSRRQNAQVIASALDVMYNKSAPFLCALICFSANLQQGATEWIQISLTVFEVIKKQAISGAISTQ